MVGIVTSGISGGWPAQHGTSIFVEVSWDWPGIVGDQARGSKVRSMVGLTGGDAGVGVEAGAELAVAGSGM